MIESIANAVGKIAELINTALSYWTRKKARSRKRVTDLKLYVDNMSIFGYPSASEFLEISRRANKAEKTKLHALQETLNTKWKKHQDEFNTFKKEQIWLHQESFKTKNPRDSNDLIRNITLISYAHYSAYKTETLEELTQLKIILINILIRLE